MSQSPMQRRVEPVDKFARDVAAGDGELERLELGVQWVVELVDGCDHASVSVIERSGMTTLAASSQTAFDCDQLQYRLGEGPCVETVRTHVTVVSDVLASDPRWPRWAPSVAEQHGIGSIVSMLLYTRDDAYGALNMYSEQPHAYTSQDFVMAHSLAAHLAVAAVAGRQVDQLSLAVVSRTVIGQAEGILIERFKVTPDGAFEMLRRRSQNSNRKVVTLAEDLVRTGEWPV